MRIRNMIINRIRTKIFNNYNPKKLYEMVHFSLRLIKFVTITVVNQRNKISRKVTDYARL
ncbi:hypothetical protein WHE01_01310 [Weissella hellenica]|nr:hypothetical protein WHE01_01310 [Weissella hellenica]